MSKVGHFHEKVFCIRPKQKNPCFRSADRVHFACVDLRVYASAAVLTCTSLLSDCDLAGLRNVVVDRLRRRTNMVRRHGAEGRGPCPRLAADHTPAREFVQKV